MSQSWPYASYDSESNQALTILRSHIPIDARTRANCFDVILGRGCPEYFYQSLRLPGLERRMRAKFLFRLIKSGDCKASYKTLRKIRPLTVVQRSKLFANVQHAQCPNCACYIVTFCHDVSPAERHAMVEIVIAKGGRWDIERILRRKLININQRTKLVEVLSSFGRTE